ncbi:TPA: prepilin peptidase-dependent protein [Klebsiella aerogenes]|nr:prepilin peptidase-dependent protein [Klebsiella aerogenes]
MPVAARGFSLIETLIAMAIGSVLLLGAARFLPALQRQILRQTQQQALENELWQRVYALAKHLQRAGYCAGQCHGQALVIASGGQCVIVRWDGNSNGIWELAPEADADSTGFRLRDGALETRRGVADCGGKNWEKMTNPAALTVTRFHVERQAISGFSPELIVTLGAQAQSNSRISAEAQYRVMGFNL